MLTWSDHGNETDAINWHGAIAGGLCTSPCSDRRPDQRDDDSSIYRFLSRAGVLVPTAPCGIREDVESGVPTLSRKENLQFVTRDIYLMLWWRSLGSSWLGDRDDRLR